ncbi:hypothetical protein RQN30_08095 [Arcanobacterium hippocoleae]
MDKMKDAQVILADLGVVRAGFSPLTAEKQKDSHSAGAFHASFHLPNSAAASLRSELKSLDSRFAAVVKALQIQDAAVQKATGKQPRTMVIFASLAEADRSGAKMQSYFKVNLANLHTDFSRSAFPAEKLPAANRNNLAFPIPDASRLAYTNSTRIPGVVQNTDILPTLAAITAEKILFPNRKKFYLIPAMPSVLRLRSILGKQLPEANWNICAVKMNVRSTCGLLWVMRLSDFRYSPVFPQLRQFSICGR